MIKKLSAVIVSVAVVAGLCSCGVNNDKSGIKSDIISVTAASTAVYNHFKDRIPEFSFKNKPVEKYSDGFSYSLSVKCSKREYKSYLKKLKKTGFEINPVEAETYYSASDNKGYFVEVTYAGEMLTVYIMTA